MREREPSVGERRRISKRLDVAAEVYMFLSFNYIDCRSYLNKTVVLNT